MQAEHTERQLSHAAGNSTSVPNSSAAVITHATLQQALQLLQQNLQQGTSQMSDVNNGTHLAEVSGHAVSSPFKRATGEAHKGSSSESGAQDHKDTAAGHTTDTQTADSIAETPLKLQLAVQQDHTGSQQQLEDTRLRLVQLQGQLAASEHAHAQTQKQLKELTSQHVQLQTQHTAAQAHHQQLATAHAAELKALVKQHSELQTAHTTTEAEL